RDITEGEAPSPEPLRIRTSLKSLRGQVVDQVRRVRRAEAGERVPAGGRRVTGNRRIRGVVPGRDVEEVRRVLARVGGNGVQLRVDQAEPTAVLLVGDGDDAGPLWAAQRRAADVVPAARARCI